jgi:hypothetical protein
MLANIWALISLILEAIGFWKFWLGERDKSKVAEGQKNTQERDKAVNEQVNAQTEEEFDKAQSDISKHLPRP